MITIDIRGIEGIQKMLDKFPDELADAFASGAAESAKEIIQAKGLQSYPGTTDANSPPTPYYIRGRGTQRGGIRIPEYNDMKSERLGTQFVIDRRGKWEVAFGNRAKYAPFVIGASQAGAMAKIGWRKLGDVADEKTNRITTIVTKWIERAIQKLSP